MNRVGLHTTLAGSKSTILAEARSNHTYLTLPEDPRDVIIDPTLGQFLREHNHVFIGTRDELRMLILGQHQISIPREVFQKTGADSRRIFERLWGSSSLTIH